MNKTTRRSRAGFTLIELLTVIAIIGILAAILFPAIGAAKKAAQKANDLSNLKSIGQSSFLFAQDNKDQFPAKKISVAAANFGQNDTTAADATVKVVAQALAKTGLESAISWISKADSTTTLDTQNSAASAILNDTKDGARTSFSAANLAFGYVVGLNSSSYSPSTPLAFTRGIVTSTDGKWVATTSPYGAEGGYILFVGGNVSYFKSLGLAVTSGELTSSNGALTNSIIQTVKAAKTSVSFVQEDNTGASAGAAPTGL